MSKNAVKLAYEHLSIQNFSGDTTPDPLKSGREREGEGEEMGWEGEWGRRPPLFLHRITPLLPTPSEGR
jgi:hypothetical protein